LQTRPDEVHVSPRCTFFASPNLNCSAFPDRHASDHASRRIAQFRLRPVLENLEAPSRQGFGIRGLADFRDRDRGLEGLGD
jgi:hypothetical protein